MAGFAVTTEDLDVGRFRDRILRFDESYVEDWQSWVSALQSQRDVAGNLGRVLRKWQACRPNRMRRAKGETKHDPPYLEDLVADANPSVQALRDFDVRLLASFTQQAQEALEQLWDIFQDLSYQGPSRSGLAGAVGISKAVLLLTEGRVGPAFDSEVRRKVGIRTPENARESIHGLQVASRTFRLLKWQMSARCKKPLRVSSQPCTAVASTIWRLGRAKKHCDPLAPRWAVSCRFDYFEAAGACHLAV